MGDPLPTTVTHSPERQWKAISLFAGAGGCSLGFRDAGVRILGAFENAQAAIDTYNTNFGAGACRNTDLSSCDFRQLRASLGLRNGELDLILGGPPYQGFTTAGSRLEGDPRNRLVNSYADALGGRSPSGPSGPGTTYIRVAGPSTVGYWFVAVMK